MIYFLLNKHDNKVKIGYSKNKIGVKDRIISHRVGNHHRLFLIKVIQGTLKKENELHDKFSFHHVSGEWFEYSPEIQLFINKLKGVDLEGIDYKSCYIPFDRKGIEKRIVSMRSKGHKLQSIADRLNSEGIKSKRGGKWYPTSIKNTLEYAQI